MRKPVNKRKMVFGRITRFNRYANAEESAEHAASSTLARAGPGGGADIAGERKG